MLIDPALNSTTGKILAAAIEVHRTLGPGLLESIYLQAFVFELEARKLRCLTEVGIPIVYKGRSLGGSYRVDLIVEERVVVEVRP